LEIPKYQMLFVYSPLWTKYFSILLNTHLNHWSRFCKGLKVQQQGNWDKSILGYIKHTGMRM